MRLIKLFVWAILEFLLSILPDTYRIQKLRGALFTLLYYRKFKSLTMAPRVVVNAPENLCLGDNILFATGVWLNASGHIAIDSRVMIGPYTIIDSFVHKKESPEKRTVCQSGTIKIASDVFIAGNCTLNPGTEIGRGTTIGSQSFVKGAIPEDVFVAGIPCSIVKSLKSISK